MVADQIYEKEKNNKMMVAILSHIVEFRNGESGLHVLHINMLTEKILARLVQKTEKYNLTGMSSQQQYCEMSLYDVPSPNKMFLCREQHKYSLHAPKSRVPF